MTQTEAYEKLLGAFTVLTDEEIENFRWHLQNETPVYCGEDLCMHFFINSRGFG